jgi:zinc protease
MNRMIQRLSVTMILVLAAFAQQAQKPQEAKPAAKPLPARSYKMLKYPPLNEIKVPEPTRFELANGMIVYLVEDHELPMIDMAAMIRTGDRWEPVDKAGLAAITGTVMRTGGTPTRSGDQLDDELDRLGASVETSIGEDMGRAGVSVLKEDIDTGLTILADILQHPAFPQDKIDLAKITQRALIARRNDDPQGIAVREFVRLLFGRSSAYGHIPEYSTIDSITRADLVAFHKKFFQPENVILGVWGDFNAAEMHAKIEKAFAGWARGGEPKPPVPALESGARERAGVYFIPKDDVNQSTVYMGFIGGKRNDPDYYALDVAGEILGGGFSSRLVSHVRTEQGLAYAVGASWNAGWDRPGTFFAIGGTKSETTIKIINSIRDQIRSMSEGVTDDELARAKDAILKGMAFDFDSTAKIVRRMMTYEYFDYPRDYLQQYRANIEKVTKADVLRVSKQYLKPDELAILVLGNQKDFDQPLSTLGKVTPIDITIPKPQEAKLETATLESTAKGKALLAAACKAVGLDAVPVKDYTVTGSTAVSMPQGEVAMKMQATHSMTGKILNKMTTPMGEIEQGYDGQVFWMKTPQGVQQMPSSQTGEVQGAVFRNTVSLLENFENSGLTVQALGPAEVDGVEVEGVAISDPARSLVVKLYIDPKTGLPAKKVYTAAMLGGPPGEMEEVYSDYREVSGVKMPFKTVIFQAGKKRAEQTITDVKINPGVADAAYKKPE